MYDPIQHQLECVVVPITCHSSISKIQQRATLVREYVTAMKTAKQRNMVNREMKLAIGDVLQTIVHPIVQLSMQLNKQLKKLGKSSSQ